MGEAKRRKALRQATPDIIAKPDPTGAKLTGAQMASADKQHLAAIRSDCRRQSRKALHAARTTTDAKARQSALAAILLGTNFVLEKQLQDFYESGPEGKRIKEKISCSMGCYFCCHVMVETTIVEAIAVSMTMRDKNPAFIDKIKATAPTVAGLSPEERLVKRIPCPMLNNGLCGVHEYRPLKCRATLSFDYKPCEATLKASSIEEQSKILIPHFGLPKIIEPAITEGIRLACVDEGLQSCTVELTAALNLIFTDPAVIDRWLAGEEAFQPYT